MLQRAAQLGFLALVTSGLFPASALEIAPTTIILERDRPINMLRLTNNSPTPQTYEITTHAWSQTGGEDVLSPAPDLVVTPPVVALEPGENIIVRVGLIDAARHDDDERDYRLRVRDISPQSGQPSKGLRLRMEFLLPVFMPALRARPSLRILGVENTNGTLCVRLLNDGNTYQKLVGLKASGPSEESAPLQKYLLANTESRVCTDKFPLPPTGELTATLAPTYAAKMQTLVLPPPTLPVQLATAD